MGKLPDELVRWIREQAKLEAKLGPRGYGSKQVEDTLDEIRVALHGVGGEAVHGNDEEPGLLPLLERSVKECDEAIEGEGPSAKDGLTSLSFVIGLAFDLGKYAAGGGVDLESLQRRKLACRVGGQRSGRERANAWKAVARQIWTNSRGRLSDPKIAALICVELGRRNMLLSPRTILNEIKKWKKSTH
jgi:hypothetical protein